jgi:hypothetical protein
MKWEEAGINILDGQGANLPIQGNNEAGITQYSENVEEHLHDVEWKGMHRFQFSES